MSVRNTAPHRGIKVIVSQYNAIDWARLRRGQLIHTHTYRLVTARAKMATVEAYLGIVSDTAPSHRPRSVPVSGGGGG